MSVRITGILNNAGEIFSPNTPIKFVTIKGYGRTLKSAQLDVVTGADGSYDFNLSIGQHLMSIRYATTWEPIGTVTINDETPSPLDLDGLIGQSQPLTPAELVLMREYLEQAQTARNESAQYAADSSDSAVLSTQKAAESKQYSAQAKDYRDQTAAIATGGTATLDPEAGKIPLADQHGKIDAGWLPAAAFLRSESDMIADRACNNQLFAASGHIHSGKTFATGYTPINEGMFVRTNPVVEYENQFFIGCPSSTAVGSSETNHPVFNLSGITVALRGINQTKSWVGNIFKLPPAPKGTEVYDSATGVLTNFETDVDPKYGDVAADSNEAVARAFGLVRLDDSGLNEVRVASGTTIYDYTTQTSTSSGGGTGAIFYNIPLSRNKLTARLASTKTVTIEIRDGTTGTESSPIMHTISLNANEETVLDLNLGSRTKAQIYFRLASSSEYPVSIQYSEVSITNEVVTSPVDLVGLEFFLRPINEADPFAYPYGMSQSKLTSVDGIPTVENNVRPITHFEVYPGDTTSRGRGWNFLDGSLSDVQKAKIFQNPEHRIYRMSDGTLVQWAVSQRTIRGAGNGDWENVNPARTASGELGLIFKPSVSYVSIRGQQDSVSPFVGSDSNWYQSVNAGDNFVGFTSQKINKGIFIPRRSTSEHSHNGECYFYVITTVPRLNQGAYHPSLNPSGANRFNQTNANGSRLWHEATAWKPSTIADCFYFQPEANRRGVSEEHGKIGFASGRPDGCLYDAIYASGQGGVIDQRLKYGAWDASSAEQSAIVREEVKNGTYRGREQLVWSGIYESYASTSLATSNGVFVTDTTDWAIGDVVSVVKDGEVLVKEAVIQSISQNASIAWDGARYGYYNRVQGEAYLVVHTRKLNITVEGEVTYTDVIGDPTNILQVDALKNGWLGGWIPVIPTETINDYPYNRPVKTGTGTSGTMRRIFTVNLGENWTEGGLTFDYVNNKYMTIMPANYVALHPYVVTAKQTTSSQNTTGYNGESGLPKFVDVFSSADVNYGAHLGYSLFNFTLKGSDPDTARQRLALTEVSLDYQGVLSSGDNGLQCQKHAPVGVLDSSNDTPACKVMMYQTSKSGMASLNIVANELRFDVVSASWSDDSKMKVKNGIFTDLANASCLAVIHELSNPYGFIKNKN